MAYGDDAVTTELHSRAHYFRAVYTRGAHFIGWRYQTVPTNKKEI